MIDEVCVSVHLRNQNALQVNEGLSQCINVLQNTIKWQHEFATMRIGYAGVSTQHKTTITNYKTQITVLKDNGCECENSNNLLN